MKKFSVAWWAYSFPLTALAIASAQYAHEVKGIMAHVIMFILSLISVLVCIMLMIVSALNIRMPLTARNLDSKQEVTLGKLDQQ
jgi:tellurite resistance protein TehA-like permease